jgi:hypothetical protein
MRVGDRNSAGGEHDAAQPVNRGRQKADRRQGEGTETQSAAAQACPQECYRSGCRPAGEPVAKEAGESDGGLSERRFIELPAGRPLAPQHPAQFEYMGL